MTSLRSDEAMRRLAELEREERELAARLLAGDRAAFDRLFDRYFDRMAHLFRGLPEGEAQQRIAGALERLFGDLPADGGTPIAVHAHRVAREARRTRVPVTVQRSEKPTVSAPRR
jgi:hypothetical protein